MPSLGQTVAALTRARRAIVAPGDDAASGLQEVEGFGDNPGGLRMLTFVPPGLSPGAALVVVMHGCGQSAWDYAEGAGWRALAEREGFALLCPEQSTANNPLRCFNWFEGHDGGRAETEAASVRAMVAHMLTAEGLDPRRVYVTGLSAGGAMVSTLLALHPDVFAGGAVVAGLPFGAAHHMGEALGAMMQGRVRPAADWGDLVRAAAPGASARPVVSVWHGEADHTVAPVNGRQIVAQWTDVHGLAEAPSFTERTGATTREVWLGADGEPKVEFHSLAGLGHGVPLDTREVGAAGPYRLEAGVSSSLEIARFWGLAKSRPPGRASAEPAVRPQGLDIDGIIRRALRTAGLIKT